MALAILAGFIAISIANAAEKKIYKVAVDNNYPPFSYVKWLNKSVEGLVVDVTKEICKEIEISCEFVAMEHSETFAALESGEVDVVCVGPGLRIDMGSLFLNSEKFFRSSSIFLGLNGAIKQINGKEMKGKKVGVVKGSLQDWYITTNYKDIVVLKEYEDFEGVIRSLNAKETNVGLVDIMAVYYYLQSDKELKFDVFGEPVIIGDGGFMMVRKDESTLLKKINEAILAIHYTSVYENINATYFDFFIF
jgi:ABC-type amino acid transport substrate-binding protein